MISAIVAALSIVTLLVTTSIIISKGVDMKKQYDDRLHMMADQVNNTQYYNSQVNQKQNSDLKEVRKTYSSKDEIARSIDTKELSVKKAQAQDLQAQSITGDVMKSGMVSASSMVANKIISPGSIVSSLDASKVNTGRINLVGDTYGRGALNFSSTIPGANTTGEYLIQRGIQENKNDVVVKMPKDAQFSFMNENNKASLSIQPNSGSLRFADKWTMGATNYDSLDINYDNSQILKFKQENGKTSSVLNTPFTISQGGLTLSNNSTDSIQFVTSTSNKGIYSTGSAPFTINAVETQIGGLKITKDTTNVNGIRFGSNANFVNQEQEFLIKGNPSIGLSNNVNVYGQLKAESMNATNLTTGTMFAGTVNASTFESGKASMSQDAVKAGQMWTNNLNAKQVRSSDISSDGDAPLFLNWNKNSNSINMYGNVKMGSSGLSVGTWEPTEPGSIKTTGTITSSYLFAQSNQDMHLNRGRDENNIALYGKVQVGSGGLSVGTWEPTEPGSIKATGTVTSSYLFAQSNEDMHLNRGRDSNNIALYGGVKVGSGGLSVGTWAPADPGSVNATSYIRSSYLFAQSNQDMHLNRGRDSNSIALYGGVKAGSGGLSVGTWEDTEPGSIQATGFIRSSYLFAQSNQDMHLNRGRDTNNIALYGGVKVGSGGLSVGSWENVPYGMVRSTNTICINSTCLSEPEIKKIKSMIIS